MWGEGGGIVAPETCWQYCGPIVSHSFFFNGVPYGLAPICACLLKEGDVQKDARKLDIGAGH